MFAGYVVVALLAAALNGWAATADFTRAASAVDNAARVGVPQTWLFPLGGLKAAGAVGLLVGIAVPVVGVAAAIGLVLFFVCAVFAHLRVRWYSTLAWPGSFLLLAVGALLLRLASL
jgi:DoxX-like family